MHRDIKSENVLCSREGDIKLCDFGLADQLTDSKPSRNEPFGTLLWMAPEVIKREEYSLSIDVWSFGILVIELAAGNPPYSDLGIPVAQFQIINSKGKAPRLDD